MPKKPTSRSKIVRSVLNPHEMLDAIIAESEEGENRFLRIYTDIFGGTVEFDDKLGLYVWKEEVDGSVRG